MRPCPPNSFNFAEHLFALNRGRAQKTAYVDDRGTLALRRARRPRAPPRRRPARRGRAARRPRAAADARQQRLAGELPRRLYAGVVPVAVNTLLTADDYAYMLSHSGADGGAGVGRAAAGAAGGDGARGRNELRTLFVSQPTGAAARRCAGLRRGASRPTRRWPRPPPRRRRTTPSGSIPPARPASPRARCTRTPTRGGRPSCTASRCWA